MSNTDLAASIAGAATFDPRMVPALYNGGIWSSRLNIASLGGGSFSWANLGVTQQNTRFTSSAAYDKPTQTTAANSVPVWSLTKATYGGGFIIDTAHECLRNPKVGSIAGWFKATAADSLIHGLFDAWPDAGAKRIWIYKNNQPTKLSVYGSSTGAVDGYTWKYNNTEGVQTFTNWTFIRVSWDFQRANYSDSGANFSDRLTVCFNEQPDRGQGFSAPAPPNNTPPNGPVQGAGLYFAQPQRLTVGVTGSSTFEGLLGHVYVANGDEGLNPAVWRRVMEWDRPA